ATSSIFSSPSAMLRLASEQACEDLRKHERQYNHNNRCPEQDNAGRAPFDTRFPKIKLCCASEQEHYRCDQQPTAVFTRPKADTCEPGSTEKSQRETAAEG